MGEPGNIPRAGVEKKPPFGCAYVGAGLLVSSALVLFVSMTAWPALQTLRAQGWDDVPCYVVESKIAEGAGSDDTLYIPRIRYRYVYDGVPYEQERLSFLPFGSTDYGDIVRLTSRYPVGSETRCYVNPRNPEAVVLTREFGSMYAGGLWGIVPLMFVIGMVLLPWKFFRRKRPLSARGKKVETAYDVPIPPSQDLKSSEGGPIKRLIGTVVFSLFWNGIVGVFVGVLIFGEPEEFSWFMALFLVPFVLVGLFAIGLVIYYFLALFNPRPRLKMEPGAVRLGETGTLVWRFEGAANRIQRLTIQVEAIEWARYTRGTDTVTEERVFERFELFASDEVREFREGRIEFSIPEFTMHSFDAPDNKFTWRFLVNGDIPRWPDVAEKFDFDVRPLPLQGGVSDDFRETRWRPKGICAGRNRIRRDQLDERSAPGIGDGPVVLVHRRAGLKKRRHRR